MTEAYPEKLQEIIEFFEYLSDDEKRENLIAYADNARHQEPRPNESFDLEDIRKDEECTDTVGVFLKVDMDDRAWVRISLGPAGADAHTSDDFNPLQGTEWLQCGIDSGSASGFRAQGCRRGTRANSEARRSTMSSAG